MSQPTDPDLSSPEPGPVLLIDLSSLIHPLYHMSGQEPDPDWTSHQAIAKIHTLSTRYQNVGICIDRGKSFRKQIDPAYKANRPPHEEALHHQIAVTIERLEREGYPIFGQDGLEADDVIAAAVWAVRHLEITVTIASSDKDLLQLVRPGIEVLSLRTGQIIDAEGVWSTFGVRPDQIGDYLALVGDKADNIEGVKGIGGKKAADLLLRFGTLAAIREHAMKHPAGSDGKTMQPAVLHALREAEPHLDRYRQLVALNTESTGINFASLFDARQAAPADPELEEAIRDDIDYALGGFEPAKNLITGLPLSTLEPAQAPDSQPPGTPTGREAGVWTPGPPGPTRAAEALAAAIDQRVEEQVYMSTHDERYADPEPGPAPPAAAQPEAPDPAPAATSRPFGTPGSPGPTRDRPNTPLRILPAPDPAPPVDALAKFGALAQPSSAAFETQLAPTNAIDAYRMSKWLHASKLFSNYGSPEAVLSVVLAGRELGLGAMASLRGFHIIEGRPSMAADLIRSLVISSGKAEYFRIVERTADRATWETKRKGDPQPVTLTYTWAEAEAAQVPLHGRNGGPTQWVKSRADMLAKTASTKLARLVYPDVCFGLYAPAELGGEEI